MIDPEEPLSACKFCGEVGTEDDIRYYWDGLTYDEPLCRDCKNIYEREAQDDPWQYPTVRF